MRHHAIRSWNGPFFLAQLAMHPVHVWHLLAASTTWQAHSFEHLAGNEQAVASSPCPCLGRLTDIEDTTKAIPPTKTARAPGWQLPVPQPPSPPPPGFFSPVCSAVGCIHISPCHAPCGRSTEPRPARKLVVDSASVASRLLKRQWGARSSCSPRAHAQPRCHGSARPGGLPPVGKHASCSH